MSGPAGDFNAADWFAQSRSGTVDPASEQYWLRWIQDDGHQRSYENCELAWELSAELRNTPTLTALLGQADSLVAPRHSPRAAVRPKWRVPVRQLGLAAAVLALGAFGWLFISRPSMTEYSTAVGDRKSVV